MKKTIKNKEKQTKKLLELKQVLERYTTKNFPLSEILNRSTVGDPTVTILRRSLTVDLNNYLVQLKILNKTDNKANRLYRIALDLYQTDLTHYGKCFLIGYTMQTGINRKSYF